MNQSRALSVASDVVRSLSDREHLPESAEDALRNDDGVVHLANAYKQIDHADRSGVAWRALRTAERETELALRQRCVDVLRDSGEDGDVIESLRYTEGDQ